MSESAIERQAEQARREVASLQRRLNRQAKSLGVYQEIEERLTAKLPEGPWLLRSDVEALIGQVKQMWSPTDIGYGLRTHTLTDLLSGLDPITHEAET